LAFVSNEVRIANDALSSLGSNTIASLTESTKQAVLVETFFDFARRFVLSQYPWAFAKRQQVLAQTGDAPALDRWDYEYRLPSDIITLLEVRHEGHYDLQEDLILSNDNTLEIYYLKDITNVVNWTPGFTTVFTAYLAYKLSFPLTQSGSAQERAFQAYTILLKEAKGNDASQKNYRKLETSGRLTRTRQYGFGDGATYTGRGNF